MIRFAERLVREGGGVLSGTDPRGVVVVLARRLSLSYGLGLPLHDSIILRGGDSFHPLSRSAADWFGCVSELGRCLHGLRSCARMARDMAYGYGMAFTSNNIYGKLGTARTLSLL